MPLGVINEPRLVVEAVLKMIRDDGQHVMVWRYHSKVSAILCLLKTDKLLHAQLLMEHAATGIPYCQHIRVRGIALERIKGTGRVIQA